MKNLLKLILFTVLLILVQACNKDNDPIKNQLLAGTWEIESTSGGITGWGYDPNFLYLEIDQSLNFKMIDSNETIIAEGVVVEVNSVNNNYTVNFEAQTININNYIAIAAETQLMVEFDANTLNLTAPCCDRMNSHFIKFD